MFMITAECVTAELQWEQCKNILLKKKNILLVLPEESQLVVLQIGAEENNKATPHQYYEPNAKNGADLLQSRYNNRLGSCLWIII